tara:strand:- start:686 stop:970 length:285 start_codon:yes stop_codon:yes gene_type:complete
LCFQKKKREEFVEEKKEEKRDVTKIPRCASGFSLCDDIPRAHVGDDEYEYESTSNTSAKKSGTRVCFVEDETFWRGFFRDDERVSSRDEKKTLT